MYGHGSGNSKLLQRSAKLAASCAHMSPSPKATAVLLVRHGHVLGISPERFRGRLEIELSERGIAEARKTAEWIARYQRPVMVYTSPLKRCRDTGGAVAAQCEVPAEVLNDLIDLDYGEWQGRTHQEVRTESPDLYARWHTAPHLMRIPGGESLQELVARSADAFRWVMERHPANTIVIVAHESVNRALLLQLLDQPLSAYHTLAQDPCAINEIDSRPDQTRVRALNQTMHLIDLPDDQH